MNIILSINHKNCRKQSHTCEQASSGVLEVTPYRAGKSRQYTVICSMVCSKAGAIWVDWPMPCSPHIRNRGRYIDSPLAWPFSELKKEGCWTSTNSGLPENSERRMYRSLLDDPGRGSKIGGPRSSSELASSSLKTAANLLRCSWRLPLGFPIRLLGLLSVTSSSKHKRWVKTDH